MSETLPLVSNPELIFGLVAPIGVDLDLVGEALGESLDEMGYDAREFRLTELMREIPIGLPLAAKPSVQSYKDRISYANAIRGKVGDDGLAAMAVSAIRTFRAKEWAAKRSPEQGKRLKTEGSDEERPIPSQSYIIRQLKRPEEVSLLRSIYGRQFILVSAYAPEEIRRRRIEDRERTSRGGLISDVEAHRLAYDLISQDSKEALDEHGQNLRDAFPLGDVFIDTTSRAKCKEMIRRFIYLLFGSNEHTPTHDEYGMYIAKSASLRSSDLSRQVGAAIFRESGEVVTMGCNEVPKSGGGTYWTEDESDRRDFVQGNDPNEQRKKEVLVDIIDRLKEGNFLSRSLQKTDDPYAIAEVLLSKNGERSVKRSKIMDLIEFGRIIHAEMSAITDAARKGVPVEGGTLYCTTFPCHLCAKHIVSAGLKRVVYLEPYPKSYTSDLHSDSIEVDGDLKTEKVSFDAFIGVSPYRYRDLFEKGKRKYSTGQAQKWDKGSAHPMIEVYYPSYFQAETHVVGKLATALSEANLGLR